MAMLLLLLLLLQSTEMKLIVVGNEERRQAFHFASGSVGDNDFAGRPDADDVVV